MNKVVNLFSLFLIAIYGFLTIGSAYDLAFSVYHVRTIPFIDQLVIGLTILILLLGLIRIKRRREGKKDISSFSKFQFSTPLSEKQKKATSIFLSLETLFMVFFIVILLVVYPHDDHFYVLPLLIIMVVLGAENAFFLYQFQSSNEDFKIGISNELVAYFDREMHLYYYDGLQRVEIYQNMLNFKYKKGLNLFLNLDVIPENKMKAFLQTLKNETEDKAVFFDDSFHQYLTNLTD